MIENKTFKRTLDSLENEGAYNAKLEYISSNTKESIEKSWNDCIYYFAEFFKGYASYIQDCFQFNKKPSWGSTSILLAGVVSIRKNLKELDVSLEKMEQALTKRMEYYKFPSRFPKND